MTTLAITPASGSITATKTVCRVTVAGAPTHTNVGYNGTIANPPTGQAQYPASPAEVMYLDIMKGAARVGRSYQFSPGQDGAHVYNNYIFPSAGSFTLNLIRVRDSGVEATLAVTVA